MAKKHQNEPVLDHTRLTFPSDGMKLGAFSGRIKEAHTRNPNLDLEDVESMMLDLYAVMDAERRLAEQAFAQALGRPDPYREAPFSSREELVGSLVTDYERFGIASGPAQVNELVRGIEKQATAQAEEFQGRGR